MHTYTALNIVLCNGMELKSISHELHTWHCIIFLSCVLYTTLKTSCGSKLSSPESIFQFDQFHRLWRPLYIDTERLGGGDELETENTCLFGLKLCMWVRRDTCVCITTTIILWHSVLYTPLIVFFRSTDQWEWSWTYFHYSFHYFLLMRMRFSSEHESRSLLHVCAQPTARR